MNRNITVAAALLRGFTAVLVVVGTMPVPFAALAQAPPPAPAAAPPLAAPSPGPPPETAAPEKFSVEQLDAMLAPIALYPDPLLAQVLMASAYPVQIVQAQRWLDDPAHKSLSDAALEKALQAENWDPSVKSLVPFPQVLSMMSAQLDWTQQLGYAMAAQQKDVMDSVQRLRRQAQIAGKLQSTPQQAVTSEGPTVIIQPAQPDTVYVPVYDPSVVYGDWPYPAYPPVYYPPPPGYIAGSALVAGLAFGAGVAIAGGLWGIGYPNWRYGNVNVNVNRWNTVNINRTRITSANWRPPATTLPARVNGPVGRPVGAVGLPANAVCRPNVRVPSGAVNRPTQRPAQLPARQNAPANQLPAAQRPAQMPARATPPAALPAPTVLRGESRGNALSGVGDGARASQYSARGSQSIQTRAPAAGGGLRGGAAPAAAARGGRSFQGGAGAARGGGGGRGRR
jgi:hypothetical protein